MRRRPYLQLLLYLLLLSTTVWLARTDWSFDLPGWLSGVFRPSTARELYSKQARREGLIPLSTLERWDSSYRAAAERNLTTNLPYREVVATDSSVALSARAFRFRLPPGRGLRISAREVAGGPVLGELFRTGRKHPVAYWDTLTNYLEYAPEETTPTELTLLVQPLPGRPARYDLRMLTAPQLQFPVAGKDDRAIQSFWGAARDGGRRRHEGNDIFAPKRTPLLAVAEGRVSRVGDGGLGGKTVWLRDGEGRGLSYYYAHLDEQLVAVGDYLQRGDTLGLVGNTGNARTTPPHLHFGIYRRGAMDPFPFLDGPDDIPAAPGYQLATGSATLKVPDRGNHYLRGEATRNGTVLRQLDNGEAVTALGATGRFYRIRTERGEYGFVNFD